MALKKTLNSAFGFTVEDAYIRVENVQFPNKFIVEFDAACYADANQTVAFSRTRHGAEYDIEGENPFKQSYYYLKTLPQLDGAVDC